MRLKLPENISINFRFRPLGAQYIPPKGGSVRKYITKQVDSSSDSKRFFLKNVRYNVFVDATSIDTALTGLPIGPVRYYERVGSTNDEAAQWAENGAQHFALVIADEQTQGRGRSGRSWFTPPGAALAISLILKPPFPRINQLGANSLAMRLTGLGALSVCEALNQDYHLSSQIKWPNDVLIEGQKVAGVLTEAQWQGDQLLTIILGIGVNNGYEAIPPQGEATFPATCIQASLTEPITRTELLRAILLRLLAWYERLGEKEFINTWEGYLAYMFDWVRVLYTDPQRQEFFEGQVMGLAGHGSLRLRDHEGQITMINNGEIRLRPS